MYVNPAQKLIWSGILFHVRFKFLPVIDVDLLSKSCIRNDLAICELESLNVSLERS